MLDERFEFSLTQYLDGQLPSEEREALEQRLAVDAEAREALEAYRRIDGLLKASAPPIPEMRWDKLAEHLSAAVSADLQRREQTTALRGVFWSTVAWRITRGAGQLALAACLLIGLALLALWHRGLVPTTGVTPPPQAIAEVFGPQAESADGVAVVEIGSPTAVAGAEQAEWYAAEQVISQPARVVIANSANPSADGIASGGEGGQDTSLLPY